MGIIIITTKKGDSISVETPEGKIINIALTQNSSSKRATLMIDACNTFKINRVKGDNALNMENDYESRKSKGCKKSS